MSTAWSTCDAVSFPAHRRINTGRHTARVVNGSVTTRPRITHRLPRETALPGWEPSCDQNAWCTLRPRRRNSVSSTATSSPAPAGTKRSTTSRASTRPTRSTDHRAAEKNRCARWWLTVRAAPAPSSIPHTVRRPVCADRPTTSSWNIANVGAVKHDANASNSAARDSGTIKPGSIG